MPIKRLARKVLDIDKHNLPEECEQHVSLYAECAEYVAEARADHEKAEMEFKVVEAELDQEIRAHPYKFGLEKVTDKAVENKIKTQKSYCEAYIRMIEAKHEKDVQELMLRGFEQRKSMLSNLVSLLIGSFYAEPKPKDSPSKDKIAQINKDRVRRGEDRE